MTLTGSFSSGARELVPNRNQFTLDIAEMLDDLLTAWSPHIDAQNLWGSDVPMRPDYWFYAAAPAAAGFMYDRVMGGSKWRAQGIATVEGAIDNYKQANGSLGTTPTGNNGIDTGEFGRILATCIRLVGPYLTPAMRDKWMSCLMGAANYMGGEGTTFENINFYANGNLQVAFYTFERMVHQITGIRKYGHYADKAWWTAHHPEESIDISWEGWGWVYNGSPAYELTPYDGSNINATDYFTEQGTGDPGLDWDYVQLNLSHMALHYLFDRETRIAHHINMHMNTAWPRVAYATDWTYETKLGSRKGYLDSTPRPITFDTPALYVCNVLLGRTDFASHEDQFYTTGDGGITHAYGVNAPLGATPGLMRGIWQQLGCLLMYAAGL